MTRSLDPAQETDRDYLDEANSHLDQFSVDTSLLIGTALTGILQQLIRIGHLLEERLPTPPESGWEQLAP